MKINYLILLFLVGITSQAQMYVSPNSYMFVNDQYVYVTGNVELNAATSNVYLRNNSQLLQGTTVVNGANTGLGALSVFQEGTVNNYQYNYWCSPVGGSLAVAGNSAFGITQLGIPSINLDTRSFTAATILPIGNYNGVSANGALSIAPYWIWKYITRTAYDPGGPTGWIHVRNLSTLLPGEGFTMKGTSGADTFTPFTGSGANNAGSAQRYDYRGKPNDGTINVSTTAGTQTLTGNPYPSAIDMNLFLTDPTNTALIDGNALYWEHDKTVNSHLIVSYRGGYGVYNGTTSIYTPATFYAYDGAGTQLGSVGAGSAYQRRFAPIGQGFMVRGTATGTAQLKNTHRVFRREGIPTNSQFERSAQSNLIDYGFYEAIPNVAGIDYTQISKAPTPHIVINTLLNNQGVRQMSLAFMPTAIDGVDRADARSADVDANLPFDTYFALDNTEYAQTTTSFDITKKFPVGFKNNAPATFRVKVAEFVNFSGAENVYLHDKTTDLYHDIKNAEYEFSMPIGVNNDRFEITFQNQVLSTNENIADNFTVFQNNENSILTIKNPKAMPLQTFVLYDISGKTILSKTNLGSNLSYEYSTSGLSEGVYIVKLTTETNQVVAKKVSIFNKK
ncbi:T9SS sorting signal type C domain-containing protein [Flavobacterium sp.]|uniref:T9SS sorting signal type C domain-containing protein n=1 Tax=Flavobacterium sp. TaxID=239 RepID=UPI00374D9BBD